MPIFVATHPAALASRILSAVWLAIGMSMSTGIAHAQVKRLAPVEDPTAAALLDRAEKDLERAISGGDAFFDSNQGTVCPLSHDEISRATAGPLEHARAMQRDISTREQEPETARLTMLSGTCPQGGLFNGPVEYLVETMSRTGYDTLVATQEKKERVTSVFVNGNPVGERLTFRWMYIKSFNRLTTGELIEIKAEHPTRPVYTVRYGTFDGESRRSGAVVDFSWMDMPTIRTMTIITRAVDGDRDVTESYYDGKFVNRIRYKHHQLHGWTENFQPELIKMGLAKQCFQNGQMIKALDCPDT